MSEKRKTNRHNPDSNYTSNIIFNGKTSAARVLDVSAGGMRLLADEYMLPETEIFCKIDIFPGMKPFYVKGRVVRVLKEKEKWAVGVKFDTVRIYNFFDIKKLHK